MSDEPIIRDGLIIRPGDTLVVVVRSGTDMSEVDAADFKAMICKRLPDLKDVILLTGVDHVAAYRPEPAG